MWFHGERRPLFWCSFHYIGSNVGIYASFTLDLMKNLSTTVREVCGKCFRTLLKLTMKDLTAMEPQTGKNNSLYWSTKLSYYCCTKTYQIQQQYSRLQKSVKFLKDRAPKLFVCIFRTVELFRTINVSSCNKFIIVLYVFQILIKQY